MRWQVNQISLLPKREKEGEKKREGEREREREREREKEGEREREISLLKEFSSQDMQDMNALLAFIFDKTT